MTGFDYVVLAVVGLSLLMGLWRGVVGELVALAAWALAIVASLHFGPLAGEWLFASLGDGSVRVLAGYAAVFVAVLVLMALIRMAMRQLVKALGLTVSDRILGAVFGLARGLLVVMVLVALGGMTAAPQQVWWKNAMFSAPLETAVLVARGWLPEDLAKRIRFN